MRKFRLVLAIAVMGLGVEGCTGPVIKNGPLAARDPLAGYRFNTLKPGLGNTDDVFVCLCFSGGGTRAAALSYGVLKALRDTPIPSSEPSGASRRLLDEVDVISSVSGGSFTSMSFGLDRDGVFDGAFERQFLKENIQRQLIFLLLRPANLLRLPYIVLDRIDLAADYYDKAVFRDRTYRDLLSRGDRPFHVVNATNVALGERFEFTQDDFDLLGSDLATWPVGHAVAASSALPLVFSPLRLKYYPGEAADSAIDAALIDDQPGAEHGRRFKWASSLIRQAESNGDQPPHELDAERHQYLYLLDGGLTDNLGVTYVIDELRRGGIRQMIDDGRIRKLVVIVVDANTDAPEPIEHKSNAPGLVLMALKTGTTSMYNYSEAMMEVLRYLLREEPRRLSEMNDRCRDTIRRQFPDAVVPDRPPSLRLQSYLVEVSLHEIADPRLRRRFLSLPTTFFLSSSAVDDLIDMGEALLRQSGEFQRLIRDLDPSQP